MKLLELKCSLFTAHLESVSSEKCYLEPLNYCILLASDESVALQSPQRSLQVREFLSRTEATAENMVQCKEGYECTEPSAETNSYCRHLIMPFLPPPFLSDALIGIAIFPHKRDEPTHVNEPQEELIFR